MKSTFKFQNHSCNHQIKNREKRINRMTETVISLKEGGEMGGVIRLKSPVFYK